MRFSLEDSGTWRPTLGPVGPLPVGLGRANSVKGWGDGEALSRLADLLAISGHTPAGR